MKEDVNKIINRFAKSHARYLRVNLNDDEILEIEKPHLPSGEKRRKTARVPKAGPQLIEIKSEFVGLYKYKEVSLSANMMLTSKILLGYVDSMGISHEIFAGMSGILEEIYVEEGDVVEYGQVLFLIREEN